MTTHQRPAASLLLASLLISTAALRAQPAAPPHQLPQQRVSQQRLMDHVASLPTKRSPRASPEHIEGLRMAQLNLRITLADLGYEPVVHEIADRHGLEPDDAPWHNIIADLPGLTAPNDIIIIGAHFDAVPQSPGADDNATGTAAILELARVLKPYQHHKTIRFALFNLEETGLIGSKDYAFNTIKPLLDSQQITITGMISLDMLGFFSDQPNSQKSPLGDLKIPGLDIPTVGDFIGIGTIAVHRTFSQPLDKAMRAAAPDLKLVTVDVIPIAPPDFLRSDHAPFLAIGVPALIISDSANFRSPHYHQPTDTIDTLDPARFTTVVRALAGALHTLAGPIDPNAPPPTPPSTPAPQPKPSPASPSSPPPNPAP